MHDSGAPSHHLSDPIGSEVHRFSMTNTNSYYHSSHRSSPHVYHWHEDCPTGSQIPAHNRESGKGRGNRACKDCEDLD